MSTSSKNIYRTELLFLALCAGPCLAEVAHDGHVRTWQKHRICEIDHEAIVSSHEAKDTPSYFFKPLPDGKRLAYSYSRSNYLLDLDTGKQVKVPGYYDLVPTPDGKLLTAPFKSEGLKFYSPKTIQADSKPVFVDQKMQQLTYQSLGVLESKGDITRYRAVIGSANPLKVQDYEVDYSGAIPEVRTWPSKDREPVPLCPGRTLALPMISKTGTELAAYDTDTQTTKVFSIDAKGECKEVLDLGIATGKVEFSYNGKKLAFHVFAHEKDNQTFAQPGDNWVSNVYVYDRDTRKIVKVTHNTDVNSVYPAWRPDGTLVVLDHPKAKYVPQQKPKFTVIAATKLDAGEPLTAFHKYAETAEQVREKQARLALGTLWASVCAPEAKDYSRNQIPLLTLGMGEEECRLLVKAYWSEREVEVKKALKSLPLLRKKIPVDDGKIIDGMKESDLLSACPKRTRSAPPKIRSATAEPPKRKEAAVPESCRICHSNQNEFPWDDVDKLRKRQIKGKALGEHIRDRIHRSDTDPLRMPPPGNAGLTDEEKKKLLDYLGISPPTRSR